MARHTEMAVCDRWMCADLSGWLVVAARAQRERQQVRRPMRAERARHCYSIPSPSIASTQVASLCCNNSEQSLSRSIDRKSNEFASGTCSCDDASARIGLFRDTTSVHHLASRYRSFLFWLSGEQTRNDHAFVYTIVLQVSRSIACFDIDQAGDSPTRRSDPSACVSLCWLVPVCLVAGCRCVRLCLAWTVVPGQREPAGARTTPARGREPSKHAGWRGTRMQLGTDEHGWGGKRSTVTF